MSRKKSLVTNIIGIYLIIVALICFLITFGVTILASNLQKTGGIPDNMPPINAGSVVPLFAIFAWCFSTGIGIIMRKSWSRYSLIALSIFALLMSILFLLASVAAPVLAVFPLVFLVGIPIFFIIYFKKNSVLFMSTETSDKPKLNRPIGITIIAWLNLVTLLGLANMGMMSKIKLPLFGVVLSTNATIIYYSLIYIISLVIAVGFFKLWRSAWYLYIGVQLFFIVAALVNLIGLTESEIYSAMANMNVPAPQSIIMITRFSQIFGLIFSGTLLVYVICRKRFFFRNEVVGQI